MCLAAVASVSVSYNPKSICVLERSSVDFKCTFDYPYYSTLETTKWFKPEAHQKQDGTQVGISVYHSNTAEIHQLYKNRTAYANQDRNCSLQLHNVSKNDNGMYFFRFEYSYRGKYTGLGGIHLSVAGKWKASFVQWQIKYQQTTISNKHSKNQRFQRFFCFVLFSLL